MKLAIITTPDRVEQDKILARNAKKKFSDVIYTSIDNIKLKVGDEFGVYCNGDNLIDSDYTLLIPTLKYREFFYTTVRILENCRVPTSVVSEKFFIIWNRVLLLRTLAKEGIKVRKAFSIAQNVVLDKVLKELKLPVIITTTTGKRIYVNNEEALKDVLSLFEAGYMITFEKPITPESIIWSFVVGNEVVASYEKVEKKMRSIVLDEEIKKISVKVRKIVGADYCAVNFIKKRGKFIVNNVSLSPNFTLFYKITGKDVSNILVSYIAESLKKKKNILETLIEGIQYLSRLIGDAISNIRTIKKRV